MEKGQTYTQSGGSKEGLQTPTVSFSENDPQKDYFVADYTIEYVSGFAMKNGIEIMNLFIFGSVFLLFSF